MKILAKIVGNDSVQMPNSLSTQTGLMFETCVINVTKLTDPYKIFKGILTLSI